MSCVTCRVSQVTCHLSLTPTATATDPPPANSPIMHNRLVCKEPKLYKNLKYKKIFKTWRYTGISDTLFDQKSPATGKLVSAMVQTDTHSDRYCNLETDSGLIDWIGKGADELLDSYYFILHVPSDLLARVSWTLLWPATPRHFSGLWGQLAYIANSQLCQGLAGRWAHEQTFDLHSELRGDFECCGPLFSAFFSCPV